MEAKLDQLFMQEVDDAVWFDRKVSLNFRGLPVGESTMKWDVPEAEGGPSSAGDRNTRGERKRFNLKAFLDEQGDD